MKDKETKMIKTGIKIIDEEHEFLLQKINELSNAINTGLDKAKIAPLLYSLDEFSKQHFSVEEKLMRDKEFPHFENHIENHKEFLASIGEIEKDYFNDGPSAQLVHAIHSLLANWLYKHIKEFDIPLAEFLRKTAES